jgi:hypothetical protein
MIVLKLRFRIRKKAKLKKCLRSKKSLKNWTNLRIDKIVYFRTMEISIFLTKSIWNLILSSVIFNQRIIYEITSKVRMMKPGLKEMNKLKDSLICKVLIRGINLNRNKI